MPTTRVQHVPLPFAQRRQTPDNSRLAALYAGMGQQLANLSLQKGENVKRGLQELAALFSGYQATGREEKAATASAARRQAERDEDKAFTQSENAAERAARAAERTIEKADREAEKAERAQLEREAKAYTRGEDVAKDVGYGPMSEVQMEDVLAGPAAGRAAYEFGPGTAEGPVLRPTAAQERERDIDAEVKRLGGIVGPNKQVIMPPKPEPLKTKPVMVNGRRVFVRETPNGFVDLNTGQPVNATPIAPQGQPAEIPTEITGPLDPDSQDLMSQAGLGYNAFLALTGRMSSLPRDRATREKASREVQDWARSKGMDVSTLASQYKAVNETLETNIRRRNAVLNVEDELKGDISNLKQAAKLSGLSDVKAANVGMLWGRGELNDPAAADYAFALNALVNDIALYNAASTGRTADQSDINEAKQVVMRGMANGSLTGLETSLNRSVKNMGEVLERSVDRSRADVWKLFGVGDKYKPKGQTKAPASDDGSVMVDGFTVRVKPGGGQ